MLLFFVVVFFLLLFGVFPLYEAICHHCYTSHEAGMFKYALIHVFLIYMIELTKKQANLKPDYENKAPHFFTG